MSRLRPILSMGCLFVLLAVATGGNLAPALSQEPEPLSPDFQITLAELGYGEKTLTSPYGTVDYTLRLPEGWELREGSFFELDVSYAYNYTGVSETHASPSLFGDVTIAVDGETRLVFPINDSTLEYSHLRVDLPLALFNDPGRSRRHTIEVTLDAGYICEIPHAARLIVHPTSFFSLSYEQLPINIDLADYPRPFYQRAFEPDQVRFVLPTQPTEMELTGAVGVAAKLGDLTYGMVISGTTDLELLDRLDAMGTGESLHEHLIVIGRPESNEAILRLNELDALPLPLKERQLSLASQGPSAVAPGSILSYTLTFTNTTQASIAALSLVDTLPAYGQMINCDPECSDTGGETSWAIPSLEAGEAFKCAVELRLSDVLTDAVIENTVTLLDAVSGPLNVSTLTTTVSTTSLAESGLQASVSTDEGYFFYQGERAVPENDGVVQEIISPWDQARAILVITGLDDKAVHKAAQAMSFESRFPGMAGQFALVRKVLLLQEQPPKHPVTDLTFADLGYDDKVLEGPSQGTNYYFDIPLDWHLTDGATLDLHFTHSQILDYSSSFLNVLFNGEPVATVALNDETSLDGTLKVKLPPAQAISGQSNRVSIQTEMHSVDRCINTNRWLLVSNNSTLHLDHKELEHPPLNLDFYPHPFDQQSDLANVLFVLPLEPQLEEWEETLQLAVALGSAAGGPDLAPVVTIATGNIWTELELIDYHIIAIGRPLRNPVLQQINAQLPQSFQPGSDTIEQQIDEVIFRLPSDLSLGLVQLLPSPLNEARAFLAVTGTTDEGVGWAVDAVANRSWALEHNLAFIKEGGISTVDTRGLTSSGMATAVATAVPEMSSPLTATVTPTALPSPIPTTRSSTPSLVSDQPDRPGWLIPLVVVNGLFIVAILGVAFWRARRRSL